MLFKSHKLSYNFNYKNLFLMRIGKNKLFLLMIYCDKINLKKL